MVNICDIDEVSVFTLEYAQKTY